MEYDALNQNSSQVGFQDVSTFVVRDQNDCDLEETVVDDSNIPPAPKRSTFFRKVKIIVFTKPLHFRAYELLFGCDFCYRRD